MALEIKPTPVLTGTSADRFLKIVSENEGKRIAPEQKEKMEKMVRTVLKKAKF
jgi:hypothetical protein